MAGILGGGGVGAAAQFWIDFIGSSLVQGRTSVGCFTSEYRLQPTSGGRGGEWGTVRKMKAPVPFDLPEPRALFVWRVFLRASGISVAFECQLRIRMIA